MRPFGRTNEALTDRSGKRNQSSGLVSPRRRFALLLEMPICLFLRMSLSRNRFPLSGDML
ncbi:hypothetical protein FIB18_05495 [Brucella pecoris]|uniref:Uncharacterized protein n=1 Tax=Brucella pecoris TaxID=867683 RepID=A0A5C5CTR1_9HYPH|nr:hypothetical protein FIB18_05495 [Brucella pecoris]